MPSNVIAFSVGRTTFGDGDEVVEAIQISIDGMDLYDVLETAQRALYADNDPDDDADDLDAAPGLSPHLVALPSRHWLGCPNSKYTEDGLAVVFDCGCGQWECGGYLARIEITQAEVIWSDFRIAGGSVLPVGPFRFSRDEYEAALAALDA